MCVCSSTSLHFCTCRRANRSKVGSVDIVHGLYSSSRCGCNTSSHAQCHHSTIMASHRKALRTCRPIRTAVLLSPEVDRHSRKLFAACAHSTALLTIVSRRPLTCPLEHALCAIISQTSLQPRAVARLSPCTSSGSYAPSTVAYHCRHLTHVDNCSCNCCHVYILSALVL